MPLPSEIWAVVARMLAMVAVTVRGVLHETDDRAEQTINLLAGNSWSDFPHRSRRCRFLHDGAFKSGCSAGIERALLPQWAFSEAEFGATEILAHQPANWMRAMVSVFTGTLAWSFMVTRTRLFVRMMDSTLPTSTPASFTRSPSFNSWPFELRVDAQTGSGIYQSRRQ